MYEKKKSRGKKKTMKQHLSTNKMAYFVIIRKNMIENSHQKKRFMNLGSRTARGRGIGQTFFII